MFLLALLCRVKYCQEIRNLSSSQNLIHRTDLICGSGYLSRYSDSLRAGRFGNRMPVGTRFSTPVRTGPGGPPNLLYNGYWVFPGGKAVRAFFYHPPHLAPRLKKKWSYTSSPSLDLSGLLCDELYLTDLTRTATVCWVNDKSVPLLN